MRSWWPLSDDDMVGRVLPSLVSAHDRRYISDRPSAQLLWPHCAAPHLPVARQCARHCGSANPMTPAGISGTGLAQVVHVVTDFVL